MGLGGAGEHRRQHSIGPTPLTVRETACIRLSIRLRHVCFAPNGYATA